jgi:hypothetical protein
MANSLSDRPPARPYGPLTLRMHMALDYALPVFGLACPWLLGYSHWQGATLYTFGLVAMGLGLNLVTQYPAGLLRLLPFAWHRWVEFTSPAPFILGPWLWFADAGAMPWAMSGIGAAILFNAALTRPQEPNP